VYKSIAVFVICLVFANASFAEQGATFVAAGAPIAAIEQGKTWRRNYVSWERKGTELVGVGLADRRLQLEQIVGAMAAVGDRYSARAKLRIKDLAFGEAAFVLGNNNRLGFSNRDGNLYVEGPIFGAKRKVLGSTPIVDDQPFDRLDPGNRARKVRQSPRQGRLFVEAWDLNDQFLAHGVSAHGG